MHLKYYERLIKKWFRLPLFLVYFLSFLSRRDKKVWIFGTYNRAFNDNTKYMYLFIEKNFPAITPVWLSKSRDSAEKFRKSGINAYYRFSLEGIKYLLAGKFYFCNTNLGDLNYWLSGGAVYINFWHGVPLKKIEFDITKGSIAWKYQSSTKLMRWIKAVSFPELYRRPDHLLVPSAELLPVFKRAFRIGDSNAVYGPYPRNSIFNYDKTRLREIISKHEDKSALSILDRLNSFEKVIFYLPTFRDGNNDFLQDSGIDIDRLNDTLKKHNYCLLVKFHSNTKLPADLFSRLTHILQLSNQMDIYPLLPFTDALLTDYSSIYVDYLLLDKEIIFFPFDIKEYMQKSREFYYNFDEITPGVKCYDFKTLLSQIENLNDLDFRKERENIRTRIWKTNRIEDLKALTEDLIKKH
ncbi:MAG: CDP-glycerol glycerophosphotransferase family protein [Calditrichaceae bacterium]